MGRSRKGSIASTSPKDSSTPKFSISGKNDENKNTRDLMDSSQNPQRTLRKHFMSSTVSAAAKSSFPRKKIWSAKKDTPFDIPPPQNSLNLENGGPAQEGITILENQAKLVGGGKVKIKKVERGKCSLKLVLEFIFVLTITAISTSYMCPPKNNNVGLGSRNVLISGQQCWFSFCMNIVIQDQSHMNCTNLCPGNRHVGCRSVHPCVLQLKTEVVEMAAGLNNVTFDPNNNVDLRLTNTLVSEQQCWFSICMNMVIQDQSHMNCTNLCPGNRHVGCRSVHHCVLQPKTEVVEMAAGLSNVTFDPNNNVDLRLTNILVSEQQCWFSICMNTVIQHQSHMNCTNLCPGNRHVGCRSVHRCVLQLKTKVVEMADGLNNDTFDPNNELLKKMPGAEDLELRPEVIYADNNNTSDETTEISDRFQLALIPETRSETFQELTRSPEDNNDDFVQEKNEPLDSEKIVDQEDMHIGKESSSETEKAVDLIDEENVSIGLIEEMGQNNEETTSWSHETTKENEHNGMKHSSIMDSDNIECDELKPMLKYREGITAAYIVAV